MNNAEDNRVLRLSEPASAGMACSYCQILVLSRRFHPKRNSYYSVVPTLLYQIFRLYPSSSEVIPKIFFTYRRILDMSIAEQYRFISVLSHIL
jgi:hypothetical protein